MLLTSNTCVVQVTKSKNSPLKSSLDVCSLVKQTNCFCMETDQSCVLVLQKFPLPLLCVSNPACTQDASGISNSLFPPLVFSIHPFLKNEEKRKILGSKERVFCVL